MTRLRGLIHPLTQRHRRLGADIIWMSPDGPPVKDLDAVCLRCSKRDLMAAIRDDARRAQEADRRREPLVTSWRMSNPEEAE